jgi:cytochrome c5
MTRSILKQLTLIASIVSTTLVTAQAPPASKPADSSAKSAAKDVSNKQPDVGERKFNANCSRCHSLPEQLSPSLAGTVVRHMRVRASLSAEDEKDILRFLAP